MGGVRVRILKALTGVMDGHALSTLLPGFTYDVPHSLSRQLIEMGIAEKVLASDPVTASPSDDLDLSHLTGGVKVVPPES